MFYDDIIDIGPNITPKHQGGSREYQEVSWGYSWTPNAEIRDPTPAFDIINVVTKMFDRYINTHSND